MSESKSSLVSAVQSLDSLRVSLKGFDDATYYRTRLLHAGDYLIRQMSADDLTQYIEESL